LISVSATGTLGRRHVLHHRASFNPPSSGTVHLCPAGPTIAGVYAPSLVNAAGTLLASTCLVARAGYAPLVAGRITLGGAAGTLTAAVSVRPAPPDL